MKKILALVAVAFLLSGCNAPKDLPAESHIDLFEQVSSAISSSVKEADTKSYDVEGEKGNTDEEVSADLSSEKPIETKSESLPEQNISTPTEPYIPDEHQEETPQVIPSQTEKIPDEPAENRDESKADEPKIEVVKSVYDYEFDIDTIREELISIGIEMGLEVDDRLTPSSTS